jgi:phosphonate transport system ATP-binding protein
MTILEVKEIHKSFGASSHVLRGVNFTVEQGEFLSIIGLSGAGKSTLLRCINRLIEPTSGEILIRKSVFDLDAGDSMIDAVTLKQRELRLLRRKMGLIFQQFNIVKRLSVTENVLTGGLGYQSSLKSCLRFFSTDDRARL